MRDYEKPKLEVISIGDKADVVVASPPDNVYNPDLP